MYCKSLIFGGLLSLAAFSAADAAIVTNDLNLRSGPGTGYGVIATMPAGTDVAVLGCTGSWCQVSYGNTVGYASASYLGGEGAYASAPVYVAPPVVSYGFGFGPSYYGYGHRYYGYRSHRGYSSGYSRNHARGWNRPVAQNNSHHRH